LADQEEPLRFHPRKNKPSISPAKVDVDPMIIVKGDHAASMSDIQITEDSFNAIEKFYGTNKETRGGS
jgi:hypothetical protein